MRASSTDSGSAGPANWIEKRIENAIAAPGAMCVIDWNSTCGSPIDPSRSRSVPLSLAVAASIEPSSWEMTSRSLQTDRTHARPSAR
jgi:hypothetical protein